jgi:hypothetical protein
VAGPSSVATIAFSVRSSNVCTNQVSI